MYQPAGVPPAIGSRAIKGWACRQVVWLYGKLVRVTKVTFTLDDDTVRAIRTLAERRRKPQSLVVREAVAAYAAQEEKLDDTEQARRLRVLDDLAAKPRTRPQSDVDKELRDIRLSRRVGWRRRPE